MTIPRIDYFNFLFNDGRGIRTNQLTGAIVQSITEAGVVTLTLADGSEEIVTLATELVRTDRDPNQDDYVARRLFYDGIELRKIIRVPVPGHDRVVRFVEDNLNIALLGTGIYVDRNAASAANPFNTRPTGLRYYNRSLSRWELWQVGEYWDTRRSVAEPQSAQGSLWIDEWPTEAAASPHASRVGQITSYPDDNGEYILHRVANIIPGVEDGFRYELDPLFSTYALESSDIDNDESDVQGTVSGRGIARGVQEHERFTDVEQNILEDVSRQIFPHPTDDWRIRQSYVAHDFFTNRYSAFLSLGWDADNRLRALSTDGHVGRLGRHDIGRIYDGSETLRSGLISGAHWLYLRDDGAAGSAIVRAPVDGGDSESEFQIILRYFTMFADPDSGTLLGILRRISSMEMEIGLLAYDAVAGTVAAEDTIMVTRAHLDAALGTDYAPLPDIHRESATGVYQEVAGAILEGDTLYLLLTDIAKTDGHTASVLVGFTLAGTPNNRTLTVLAENAVDELPVSDELTSGILPLEADSLYLARPFNAYRLSPESENQVYALDNDDIDDPESDKQGTVSGRGLERAAEEYSPFTDVEQDILEDLSRQVFPHPDDHWRIRQTYHTTDFFADRYEQFLSVAWDADSRLRAMSRNGYVARIGGHDQSRAYDGDSRLRAALISGTHWLYLRDHEAGSRVHRLPVGDGPTDTLFTIGSRYFNIFADPDSGTLVGVIRRISDAQIEVAFLAYDEVTGTLTPEDSISIDRATIDNALGSDYAVLNDIHEERTSGEIRGVTCAILEGDTLYFLLTDLLTRSGGAASVLIGYTLGGSVGARTLTILAEDPVLSLPIVDGLLSGILPLEGDSLYLSTDYTVYRLSMQSERNFAHTNLGNVDPDLSPEEKTEIREKIGAVGETVGTDDLDDNAVAKNKLSQDVRVELDRGGLLTSGLQYRINHDETSANDARSTDWVGGVFRSNRDVYMNGGNFRITENSPGTHRTYHLSIIPLFEHAENDWRVPPSDPDVPYWDMRINRDGDGFDSDWDDHYTLESGHSAHGYMEARLPDPSDPLVIRDGEFFGLVSRISTSGVDEQYYAIGFIGTTDSDDYNNQLAAVTEQDHNHPDFDHEIFTYMGEIHSGHNGRDLQGRPIMTANNVRNFAYRMSLDYAIHEAELLITETDDIANDAVTESKLHPDVREKLGIFGSATRVARVLDITDLDVWVETKNYDDTTDLIGTDRIARYMSWFDGNLYLADAAGSVNTRDLGSAITGMARGDGLFVTSEGDNIVSHGATDLAQLNSAPYGARHAIAVQQDDPQKFWTLGFLVNGNVEVREIVVANDGTIGAATLHLTITPATINAALGARYFDAIEIYVPSSGDGIVDLHVVSSTEFWIIFAGLPLAHDLTTEFTVMIKAEIPAGGNTFEFVADSVEEFARDDGRSFVRIGDGLVYLGHDSGVARYEKKSARAEVYREHQQDRLPRITEDERDAGTEDGLRHMSPLDVSDMISSHTSSMQQGSVQVGDDQWTHIYWQRAAAKPADPNFGTWDGNDWSGSITPWTGDRATAVSTVGSDPIWMAFGRSSRDNDIITTHAWSVIAEFGLQYSGIGGFNEDDWHPLQASTDIFLRMRLPDGTYTPQLHLTSVTGADNWTHIATGGVLNTGGNDLIDIGFRTIPFSGGLEGFESLLLTVTPQPIGANEFGITLFTILRRGGPDWGLDTGVDDVARSGCYNIVYGINNGLEAGRIEDDDWHPDRYNDVRQTVGGITIGTRISWRMKFNSPDADPANINAMRNFDFKSTNYVRVRLELFGR